MGISSEVISDRQWKLESEYKYKKGDQATSSFFQKIYGIGIAIFIFSIIIFASGEPAVAVLIPLAIPLIYLYRLNFGRNESWADKGKRESHYTAILVKTKSGSYEYRFRKDSYIVMRDASSWTCKVCNEIYKTKKSKRKSGTIRDSLYTFPTECYFQICVENTKCKASLSEISGDFSSYMVSKV